MNLVGQLGIICQGIAARYARRQASSEKAFIQQKMFPMFGELARKTLVDAGYDVEGKGEVKAKL
jgi:hypothetical protein